ncbi:putative uncharacterized protein DDB_G0277255 [Octopus bimaculoides]|nr:putative uncharacterized protein DDB_G0277255 [Octopus bimaculoides]|eukprot:XP_014778649.1 PREDICTED: putative uncharacterized protein DDB_G0277255 [Octopus bimaculoides]
MATEAQKLIALSLGKIAASRNQRGGINLHKNLLVASVLHRARSVYMLENYQSFIMNKNRQMEPHVNTPPVHNTKEQLQHSNVAPNHDLNGSLTTTTATATTTTSMGGPSLEMPSSCAMEQESAACSISNNSPIDFGNNVDSNTDDCMLSRSNKTEDIEGNGKIPTTVLGVGHEVVPSYTNSVPTASSSSFLPAGTITNAVVSSCTNNSRSYNTSHTTNNHMISGPCSTVRHKNVDAFSTPSVDYSMVHNSCMNDDKENTPPSQNMDYDLESLCSSGANNTGVNMVNSSVIQPHHMQYHHQPPQQQQQQQHHSSLLHHHSHHPHPHHHYHPPPQPLQMQVTTSSCFLYPGTDSTGTYTNSNHATVSGDNNQQQSCAFSSNNNNVLVLGSQGQTLSKSAIKRKRPSYELPDSGQTMMMLNGCNGNRGMAAGHNNQLVPSLPTSVSSTSLSCSYSSAFSPACPKRSRLTDCLVLADHNNKYDTLNTEHEMSSQSQQQIQQQFHQQHHPHVNNSHSHHQTHHHPQQQPVADSTSQISNLVSIFHSGFSGLCSTITTPITNGNGSRATMENDHHHNQQLHHDHEHDHHHHNHHQQQQTKDSGGGYDSGGSFVRAASTSTSTTSTTSNNNNNNSNNGSYCSNNNLSPSQHFTTNTTTSTTTATSTNSTTTTNQGNNNSHGITTISSSTPTTTTTSTTTTTTSSTTSTTCNSNSSSSCNSTTTTNTTKAAAALSNNRVDSLSSSAAACSTQVKDNRIEASLRTVIALTV